MQRLNKWHSNAFSRVIQRRLRSITWHYQSPSKNIQRFGNGRTWGKTIYSLCTSLYNAASLFFTSQEVGEIQPLLILHIIRDIRTTFYCGVIFQGLVIFFPGGIFHLSQIRNGGRTTVRCSDVLQQKILLSQKKNRTRYILMGEDQDLKLLLYGCEVKTGGQQFYFISSVLGMCVCCSTRQTGLTVSLFRDRLLANIKGISRYLLVLPRSKKDYPCNGASKSTPSCEIIYDNTLLSYSPYTFASAQRIFDVIIADLHV